MRRLQWLVLPSLWAAVAAQTALTPGLHSFSLQSSQSTAFTLSDTAESPSQLYATVTVCSPPPGAAELAGELDGSLSSSADSHAVGLSGGLAAIATAIGSTITINAPSLPAGAAAAGLWTFELGLSSAGPLHKSHAEAGFRFEDSDANTALLLTANFSVAGVTVPTPAYDPVFVPTSNLSIALGRSACFLRRQAATGGVASRNATSHSGFGGGAKVGYLLSELQPGTNYSAVLVSRNEEVAEQVSIWGTTYFASKSGNNCVLLAGQDFCPSVSYAVPSPPGVDLGSLLAYYNSTIATSVETFTRTLSTFSCGSRDMGGYSLVSGCDDCIAAYRTWLCAVTMPRCTDAPAGSTAEGDNSTAASTATQWPLFLEGAQQTILRTTPSLSRTPGLGAASLPVLFPNSTAAQSPFPYSEVPPCLSVCQLVQARCPPMVGWSCPTEDAHGDGGTTWAGYGRTHEVNSTDRMAGDPGGKGGRSADRYGNVFCNALGSDLVLASQIAPAPPSVRLSSPMGALLVLSGAAVGLLVL